MAAVSQLSLSGLFVEEEKLDEVVRKQIGRADRVIRRSLVQLLLAHREKSGKWPTYVIVTLEGAEPVTGVGDSICWEPYRITVRVEVSDDGVEMFRSGSGQSTAYLVPENLSVEEVTQLRTELERR